MFSLFCENVSPSSAPILDVAQTVWRDFSYRRGKARAGSGALHP